MNSVLSVVVEEIRADLSLVQANLDSGDLAGAASLLQATARRAIKAADEIRSGVVDEAAA